MLERKPICITQQAQTIKDRLEVALLYWGEHPDEADYHITITIRNEELPLCVNPVDVTDALYCCLDAIVNDAAMEDY